MLWVSEGFTVYYEYLMLARSGRMTLDELLLALGRNMAGYENNPGRLFQSATDVEPGDLDAGPVRPKGRPHPQDHLRTTRRGRSSACSWTSRSGTRRATGARSTRSCASSTGNTTRGLGADGATRSSVRRAKAWPVSGSTRTSSTRPPRARSTTRKYLATPASNSNRPSSGPSRSPAPIVEDRDGRLVVAAVEPHSPAAAALAAGDVLLDVDGRTVDASGFDALIKAHQPGDNVTVTVERAGRKMPHRAHGGSPHGADVPHEAGGTADPAAVGDPGELDGARDAVTAGEAQARRLAPQEPASRPRKTPARMQNAKCQMQRGRQFVHCALCITLVQVTWYMNTGAERAELHRAVFLAAARTLDDRIRMTRASRAFRAPRERK